MQIGKCKLQIDGHPQWQICNLQLAICNLFPLLIALSGCEGATDRGLIEVSGIVSYQGTPVEGANVIFHQLEKQEAALASQAMTDANGRFELRTHVGGGKFRSGIAPGRYVVTTTKLDTASIASTLAPPKNLLPKKYGEQRTSGLTADVAAGKENRFEFALTE